MEEIDKLKTRLLELEKSISEHIDRQLLEDVHADELDELRNQIIELEDEN